MTLDMAKVLTNMVKSMHVACVVRWASDHDRLKYKYKKKKKNQPTIKFLSHTPHTACHTVMPSALDSSAV